jgi:hypothetical protein
MQVQENSEDYVEPVLSLLDVSFKLMGKVPFDFNQ